MRRPALLAFILVWTACISSSATQIRVTAFDLLNGQPVENVVVTLCTRVITTNELGERRLHPIEESRVLETGNTADDGSSTFDVAITASSFAAIEISAEGYEGQIASLIPIQPGEGTARTFHLVRRNLTEAEAELVRAIHEAARDEEPADQGPFLPLPERELAAAATFPVPDEVHVENLEGFTGSMNLDEFIGGVVTREVNDGFPREALRTQAVASRSYALHRLRTRGMANGGQAYNPVSGALSRAAAF